MGFFDFWIAQKAEFCIIENKELYREFPQYASCGGEDDRYNHWRRLVPRWGNICGDRWEKRLGIEMNMKKVCCLFLAVMLVTAMAGWVMPVSAAAEGTAGSSDMSSANADALARRLLSLDEAAPLVMAGLLVVGVGALCGAAVLKFRK